MKVRSLLFGMLCMLALGASLASCSDELITQDLPFMHPIRMRISSVIFTRLKTTPSWVTLVRV